MWRAGLSRGCSNSRFAFSTRLGVRSAGSAAEGTHDAAWVIQLARRFLDAGAYQIMIESEGITENVRTWRTDVPARLIDALGLDRIMFEAADPEVFAWYIMHYGPEVNLFVDHSQIVQLESLRQGIWGTASLWGRVVTYKGETNGQR
jgi:phosphosulfolactate synthase (CoM biosynthesis protein A)